jgi:D-threo-aldose 1-dehydrogenase
MRVSEPVAPQPPAAPGSPGTPGTPALGPLGYGAANLGNLDRELGDDEARAVLEAAWDAGVRYFDTAPHYGLGLSERRLGDFLRGKPRDAFVLSTKVGRLLVPDPAGAARMDVANGFHVPADHRRVWDFSAAGIRRSIEDSLGRLGLDRVDIAYLHDPERSDAGLRAALETGIPALAALREEGVVARIGIGSMVNDTLHAAVTTGALDLAMIAGRLTLADPSALEQVVPACRAHGVGIVAAEVFNSGMLARPEPSGRFDYADADPAVLARVRRIAAICTAHGVELPTAALHFPLRHGALADVVGAHLPAQVRENRRRLDAPVPAALWDELAAERLVAA